MTLVPAAAAATWCAQHPEHRPALERALVRVGERPEVDLARVSAPTTAAAVAAWWEQTRNLWAAARGDRLSGHAWVRTRRVLVEEAQSTSKKDKRDLTEEFAALTDAGPVARLVVEASAAEPDLPLVRAMARAAGGAFVFHAAESAATLTVPLVGTMWWPVALGGASWPGEVARELTVTFRYAPWRDRRVRRCAAVRVEVVELWADPARFAPTVPDTIGAGHTP